MKSKLHLQNIFVFINSFYLVQLANETSENSWWSIIYKSAPDAVVRIVSSTFYFSYSLRWFCESSLVSHNEYFYPSRVYQGIRFRRQRNSSNVSVSYNRGF